MRGHNPATDMHGGAYLQFPEEPQAYIGDKAELALKELFHAAVTHTEDRIKWYERKSGEPAKVAKNIRFWSLLLFGVGTLAPITATFAFKLYQSLKDTTNTGPRWLGYMASLPFAEIGYILLAVAGALVVFDQFFDASGSWIRFRQAQARLEVMLSQFRFGWAERMIERAESPSDHRKTVQAAHEIRDFITKVELVAEGETKEWAQRFSHRIDTFDTNPSLRVRLARDAARQSSVESELSIGIPFAGVRKTQDVAPFPARDEGKGKEQFR